MLIIPLTPSKCANKFLLEINIPPNMKKPTPTHLLTPTNIISFRMPISLTKENEMEFVWKTYQGKQKCTLVDFPKNSNRRLHEEVTLGKVVYITTTLPQEFWTSLSLLDCPQSTNKIGRVFPVFITSEVNEDGKRKMQILKSIQGQD